MTRRQIRRIADPEHRKLLRAWHFCPRGGNKTARHKALRAYVMLRLREARQ